MIPDKYSNSGTANTEGTEEYDEKTTGSQKAMQKAFSCNQSQVSMYS